MGSRRSGDGPRRPPRDVAGVDIETVFPTPIGQDVERLAARFRLPIADLSRVSEQAIALVAEKWARRFHVLPLSATEHELVIATADPLDVDCERTLGFATGRRIRLAIAAAPAIARRIDDVYGDESVVRDLEPAVEVEHLRGESEAAPPMPGSETAATVSALVDELLAAGISSRASDIHIEAEEQGIAVRHRDRRGARRRAHAAAQPRSGARVTHQDSLGARHRRSSSPAGRPRARRDQRCRGRSARLDAPFRARREGRDPRARRPLDRADARRDGFPRRTSSSASSACCNRAKDSFSSPDRRAPARPPRSMPRCDASRSAA